MRVFSPVFSDGDDIAAKYTCDGENVSPPLEWEDIPHGTTSFSIVVDDPDAPSGVFVHWLLFNVPASENGLTEGVGVEGPTSGGGIQGKNGFGKIAYGGPCPPSGTHRYYFHLYAVDTNLDLPPGASRRDWDRAAQGHVLSEAQLMGRYARAK
jgi:Raf kinase inhibitor-like YbhB/YbcL family protein